MRKIIISIVICVLILLGACKKDVEFVPETINCFMDYSTHKKNDIYISLLNKYLKKDITGICAYISSPSDGEWIGTVGYADIENGIKLNPCHLHHTASMGKSYTAVVILQLIAEGKLSFDDKIDQYLTDNVKGYIPNVEKITIKHLLQQTSGIPMFWDIDFFEDFFHNTEQSYTSEEILQFVENKPALYEPGTKHTYADPNYILLSLIIDKIEGSHTKSFYDRIIIPLGLENTYYHRDGYPSPAGLVTSYWDQYSNGNMENISDMQINMTNFVMGSDGVISSVSDMVTFYKAVFEGNLLDEEMTNLIKSEWVLEENELMMNTGYGYGFMFVEEDDGLWIGHTGLHLGTTCYVYQNLNTEEVIAMFSNTGCAFFVDQMETFYNDLWNDLRKL